MAEFSKLTITNKGQALVAKMMSGIGNINFTKISSSDNKYKLKELENLTALSEVKQTSLISKITRTNKTSVNVETAFNNSELATGYYMRALGLYAVDPDDGEILFGVTIETTGNCYMPPYNGTTASGAYIQLITAVGNAENVSLKTDVAAVATIGDINELREQFDNKVDKIEGKVLSSNDYTTEEKNKLSSIQAGANKTVVDDDISTTSKNPLQNRVVTLGMNALSGRVDTLECELSATNSDISTIETRLETLGITTADLDNLKVDKVDGKGLSTNDYTTAEKNKLAGIDFNPSTGELKADIFKTYTGSTDDRYVQLTSNGIRCNAPASGGFSSGLYFCNNSNTKTDGVIGAFGENGKVNYYYMGPSYSNPWIKVDSTGVTAATFKGDLSGNATKIQNAGNVLFENQDNTGIYNCTVSGLFTNNSFVLAIIKSDKYGTKQYILPMAYLKSSFIRFSSGSLNSGGDEITFQYVDDNTLRWFEKQASGAAVYTAVTLIKIL